MRPEFIPLLFPLAKLETLSLIYLNLESMDLSGFHNLRKFYSTTASDRAAIALMEKAPQLKYINLSKCDSITARVLDKAHQVTSNRKNNVPLHVVVEDYVIGYWSKPKPISPLLTVESSFIWCHRSRYGYEGNEEELFYGTPRNEEEGIYGTPRNDNDVINIDDI